MRRNVKNWEVIKKEEKKKFLKGKSLLCEKKEGKKIIYKLNTNNINILHILKE